MFERISQRSVWQQGTQSEYQQNWESQDLFDLQAWERGYHKTQLYLVTQHLCPYFVLIFAPLPHYIDLYLLQSDSIRIAAVEGNWHF